MKNTMKTILILTAVLGILLLLGACAPKTETEVQMKQSGGTLLLKVNPEIALDYDATGTVTAVSARNADAKAIIDAAGTLIGLDTEAAVSALVKAIGDAGYFIEDAEGGAKKIVLELEIGSVLPNETFLDEIVANVKSTLDGGKWHVENVNARGLTDYGVTDHGKTDYGTTDYGITDYSATDYGKTDYHNPTADTTQAAPNTDTKAPDTTASGTERAHGRTDYGVTDYGTTDYGTTDYGVTDYGKTDYGVTDYGTTDNGTTDYGKTDYGKTDYGTTDYGKTDYGATDYGVSDYGRSEYGN